MSKKKTTMEGCLKVLKTSKNESDLIKELKIFSEDYRSTFSFDDTDVSARREFIDAILKELLDRSHSTEFQVKALSALRILSRDKNGLGLLVSESACKTLFILAGLYVEPEEEKKKENGESESSHNTEGTTAAVSKEQQVGGCKTKETASDHNEKTIMDFQATKDNKDTIVEALKCLCNISFQSKMARDHCMAYQISAGLVRRTKLWFSHDDIASDISYFDLRMLFLLTAYDPSERITVVNHGGVCTLTHCLDSVIPGQTDRDRVHAAGASDGFGEVDSDSLEKMSVIQRFMIEKSPHTYEMGEEQTRLAIETLKVLFNITMALPKELDNDTMEHYERIALIVCSLFAHNRKITHGSESVHNQAINVLTCLPKKSLKFMYWKVPKLISRALKAHHDLSILSPSFRQYYLCYNMYSIHAILNILDERITQDEEHDSLISILSALCCASRGNRIIRKYLKFEILPPLGKVTHKRPEEGHKIRNKLVKLMTSPVTDVADLAAEFLYILCKENADRLIKYTGYGNAAGLLARRGLCVRREEGDYSSEEEDSDTEEYLEVKDQIDPILGAIPHERPNPLDSMTEEEKIEEAEKLRNLIIELNNLGVIKTAKLGPDGRPVATSISEETDEESLLCVQGEGHQDNSSKK